MTIQDYGSIGEIVGAIATVATLLYLAVQIRQNTRTVRVASSSELLGQQSELALVLAQNEKLAKVYFDGLAGVDLTETEARQFEMLVGVWINSLTQARILEHEGLMNPGSSANHVATTEWMISQPGFERYWSAWAITASPEVVAFVKSVREQRSGAAAQQSGTAESV